MLCVRPLAFQDALRVLHQGGVEEAEPEIVPEGAYDRDVAARMHIAGMAPFDVLFQPGLKAKPTQRGQPSGPGPCRTIGRVEAGAATTAAREIVFDLGDHGAYSVVASGVSGVSGASGETAGGLSAAVSAPSMLAMKSCNFTSSQRRHSLTCAT